MRNGPTHPMKSIMSRPGCPRHLDHAGGRTLLGVEREVHGLLSMQTLDQVSDPLGLISSSESIPSEA